jgi:ketosteroid isomerase-like protein
VSEDADIRLLREVYAEWARGDFHRSDFFGTEVEFSTDYPELATYRGPAEVARGWQAWLSAWDGFTTAAEEFIPAGDGTYVVLVHLSARGKGSGVPIEMDGANIVRVADDRIVYLRLFASRGEAMELAGLR